MTSGIMAVVAVLGGVLVLLAVILEKELAPGRKVVARVVSAWMDPYWHRRGIPNCYVKVEHDGAEVVYTCDPDQLSKAVMGATVRLHLKGKYVEYIKPLDPGHNKTASP